MQNTLSLTFENALCHAGKTSFYSGIASASLGALAGRFVLGVSAAAGAAFGGAGILAYAAVTTIIAIAGYILRANNYAFNTRMASLPAGLIFLPIGGLAACAAIGAALTALQIVVLTVSSIAGLFLGIAARRCIEDRRS